MIEGDTVRHLAQSVIEEFIGVLALICVPPVVGELNHPTKLWLALVGLVGIKEPSVAPALIILFSMFAEPPLGLKLTVT